MKIYNIHWLRRLVLPILQKTAFDFTINHPWNNGVRVKLNSFLHKGYWWHREKREQSTMKLFAKLLNTGDRVVEVGGHVGFISTYFASLTGNNGRVFVFEPGRNNLPYIKINISSKLAGDLSNRIQLIESAVSDKNGVSLLYEDSLTGQNNSLVKNFDGLRDNQKNAYIETNISEREVQIITLDSYFHQLNDENCIDFIKIDIEGHEWSAIKGAKRIISQYQPKMMIEIQASRHELFDFLKQQGYILFSDTLVIQNTPSELNGNIFCLHTEKHLSLIQELNLLD